MNYYRKYIQNLHNLGGLSPVSRQVNLGIKSSLSFNNYKCRIQIPVQLEMSHMLKSN